MTQLTFPEGHRHVLAVAFEAWSHTRPLCGLVARIVKTRPLIAVTFVSSPTLYDRIVVELSRHFDDSELSARARVRLIALLEHGEKNYMGIEAVNVSSFAHIYSALVGERPIICTKTAQEFTPIGTPDVAILDMVFAKSIFSSIRKHSASKSVKVYCWVTSSLGAVHLFWGPSSPNRDRNLHMLIQEEMERSGKPLPEAAHAIVYLTGDQIVGIPGIPPMYEHEHYPQEDLEKGFYVALLRVAGAEIINQCDGIIAATPECFEPEEMRKEFCQWFTNGTSRGTYLVGPMLPNTDHARDLEKKQSTKSEEIDEFMDRVLEEYGPKSLIYVSFGTFFWSAEPEKIWTFVDVLPERKIPFIFSHASPFAQIPEDIHEKVKNSGIGLFSSWSPQQAILQHPATAWFVTHCGYNSVMESIHFGVPMICWPYQADQPMNVAILTQHDVAYELLEIRTGLGLKPLYRSSTAPTGTPEAIRKETNHVLDQAFGEDGKKKRANVEKLRDAIAAEWTEGGSSQVALERLLDSF